VKLQIIFAEVLDKEPSLSWVWLVYGTFALVGFWFCRKNPWWLVLFLPGSVFMSFWATEDLWDPWVGPAIWLESISLYLQWHLAMAFAIAAPIVGSVQAARSRRQVD
jgi:hypothetical protein